MSNTEDSKSPLDALQEAAAELEREATPLAKNNPDTLTRIHHAGTLHEAADSLTQVAKGLQWIGLRWVPEPLKRTAAALMKMTPADMTEGALSTTADALDAAADAMSELLLNNLTEGGEKLDAIRLALPISRMREGSVMDVIAEALTQAAGAVRASDQAADQLRGASSSLEAITRAIEQAKKRIESEG